MESVSSSFRSRAGLNDEGVKEYPEEVVQKQNASEHAGGQPGGSQPQPGADEDGFGGDAPEPEIPVGEPQDGTTVAEGETEPVPAAPVAEGEQENQS